MPNKIVMTDEVKTKVRDAYMTGARVQDIAKDLGLNANSLKKYITKWKKEGFIPLGLRENRTWIRKKETKPRHRRTKAEMQAEMIAMEGEEAPTSIMKHNLERICWNEEPIKCTRNVSRNCIWGTAESAANLCDFLCRTGRSRGCHWKECRRFVQVTEDNPRAKTPFLI